MAHPRKSETGIRSLRIVGSVSSNNRDLALRNPLLASEHPMGQLISPFSSSDRFVGLGIVKGAVREMRRVTDPLQPGSRDSAAHRPQQARQNRHYYH